MRMLRLQPSERVNDVGRICRFHVCCSMPVNARSFFGPWRVAESTLLSVASLHTALNTLSIYAAHNREPHDGAHGSFPSSSAVRTLGSCIWFVRVRCQDDMESYWEEEEEEEEFEDCAC